MGRPRQIDRDALHRVLWRRTDGFNRIRFVAGEFAVSLNISEYHFSRILAEMGREGRMRVVRRTKGGVCTREIVDPDVWARGRAV